MGLRLSCTACAYQKVCGVEVVPKAVSSLDPAAGEFAGRYGISAVYEDYHEMLKDPEIDMVDIIAPPCLHADMVMDVVRSKKHVICEKPLTGFFGKGEEELTGSISKGEMYETGKAELDVLKREVEQSGCLFMYAENYIYTPALQKSLEFLDAQQERILFMRAEESHNGSHAPHAAYWKMRRRRLSDSPGLSSAVGSPAAQGAGRQETGHGCPGYRCNRRYGKREQYAVTGGTFLYDAHPVDVEDLANMTITFSDGSKAVIMAGDMVVGGVKNLVEIYTNKSVYHCNMAATDGLYTYHSSGENLEDVYVTGEAGNQDWLAEGISGRGNHAGVCWGITGLCGMRRIWQAAPFRFCAGLPDN
ncbi:MAG: Gfo/Idh/MocA family protein [Enterocloster sp.]